MDRSAGLTASVTALPSEGLVHDGTEKVVFTLLKNGQEIRTTEVSIDIQSEEKVYAYFNFTGSEYTVRATVAIRQADSFIRVCRSAIVLMKEVA